MKLDEPAVPTPARARRPAERDLPLLRALRGGVFRELLPGSAARPSYRAGQRQQPCAAHQADVGERHRALQELAVIVDLLHREPGRFPRSAEGTGPPVEVPGIQVVHLHDGTRV